MHVQGILFICFWLRLNRLPFSFLSFYLLRSLEATTLSTAALDSISTFLDSSSELLFSSSLSLTKHHDPELTDVRGRNGDPVIGVLDSDG